MNWVGILFPTLLLYTSPFLSRFGALQMRSEWKLNHLSGLRSVLDPWLTSNACQAMGTLETVKMTWDRKQFPKQNFTQLKLIPNVKYQRTLIIQTVIKHKMLSRTFTVILIKMQSHFQLHKILMLLSSLVSNKRYCRIKNAGWKCKINDNLPFLLGNTERRLFYSKNVITLRYAQ